MTFYYGLKYLKLNLKYERERVGNTSENQYISKEPPLCFYNVLTNFYEGISGRQVLTKQLAEVKSLSHIFPFMPGSPGEVILQSILSV